MNNDKEFALRIMMLLSALESWSFSQKEKMAPDYLIDELESLQDKLKGVVLS